MSECERVGKWFRGCNWQDIYDTTRPSGGLDWQIQTAFQLPKWLAEMGIEESIYVGALCKTCGKYISKDGETNDV